MSSIALHLGAWPGWTGLQTLSPAHVQLDLIAIAAVDGLAPSSRLALGVQGKRLFGFVSNAISHQNCRFEVTFNQPGGQEPVPAIHLKAQGKYPAEAYPLYQDASGSSVCGTVRLQLVRTQLVMSASPAASQYTGRAYCGGPLCWSTGARRLAAPQTLRHPALRISLGDRRHLRLTLKTRRALRPGCQSTGA